MTAIWEPIAEPPERAAVSVSNRLAAVEWDFHGVKTGGGVHGIHPYPTKFIPHIPRELIRALHPGGDAPVFDPFCGSGTTLVEASMAELPSVGVDVSPLAVLLSRVKTTPLNTSVAGLAVELVERLRRSAPVAVPEIPRLDHWFEPEAQVALAGLRSGISKVSDSAVKNALWIAMSSIVVRVSNQESDTRYAALPRPTTVERVFADFLKAAAGIDQALARQYFGASAPRVRILQRDIQTVSAGEVGTNVGLVVTSPPYPNAFEGWLYHKYRMYWLGMDPLAVKAAEIGARPKYFTSNPATELDFEVAMARCLQLLREVMQKDAFACFVIGRSIIRGEVIDNAAMIARIAPRLGFVHDCTLSRNIQQTKRSFNPSISPISRESIVVLQLKET